MKIRMTVTVEVDDPLVYQLDDTGWATGVIEGYLDREDVGEYVLSAVSYWGGQFAPGDPLFPSNIKSVRVKGRDFDLKGERTC